MLLTIKLHENIDDEGIDYLASVFPLCGKDKRCLNNTNEHSTIAFHVTTITSKQDMWLQLNKTSHFVESWSIDDQDTEATMTPVEAQDTLADAIKILKQQDIYTGRLEQVLHVLKGLVAKEEQPS